MKAVVNRRFYTNLSVSRSHVTKIEARPMLCVMKKALKGFALEENLKISVS